MNEGAKFVMVGQVGGRKNCGNATTIEMRIWRENLPIETYVFLFNRRNFFLSFFFIYGRYFFST